MKTKKCENTYLSVAAEPLITPTVFKGFVVWQTLKLRRSHLPRTL